MVKRKNLDEYRYLASQLKKARIEAGLSQYDAALLAGQGRIY